MTKNHIKNLKKIIVQYTIMSSQTKIQEEIKLDVPDLVMKNKINGLDLVNSLLYLKIILKKIDKISIVKDLEINQLK